MYCLSCGKKIPDNSKFCLFCGQAIPEIIGDEIIAPKETKSPIQEQAVPKPAPVQKKPTTFLSREQVKEWRILSEIEGWGINTSWGDKFRKIVGQLNPPFIPDRETLIFDVPVFSGFTGNSIRVGQIRYEDKNLQNGFLVATDSRFVFGDHKAKWADQIHYSKIIAVYYDRDVYTLHLSNGEKALLRIKVPRPSLLGAIAILGGTPVDKAAISQMEHDKGVIAQNFVTLFSGFLNEIVEINREDQDQGVDLYNEPEIAEDDELIQEVQIVQESKIEPLVIPTEKVPAGIEAKKPSVKKNVLLGALVGFFGMAFLTVIAFLFIQASVEKDNRHHLETQVALSATDEFMKKTENTNTAGDLINTQEALKITQTQLAKISQTQLFPRNTGGSDNTPANISNSSEAEGNHIPSDEEQEIEPSPIIKNSAIVLWDTEHGPRIGQYGSYTPDVVYSGLRNLLESENIEIFEGSINDDLSDFDAIVINMLSLWRENITYTEAKEVLNFVDNGGGLVIIGDENGMPNRMKTLLELLDVDVAQNPRLTSCSHFSDHPIFLGISYLDFYGGGALRIYGSELVPIGWVGQSIAFAAGSIGNGRVVIIPDSNLFDNRWIGGEDNRYFAMNLFRWITFMSN